MQKFRFGNPVTVVEVSRSPLDPPEPSKYTIYNCRCRPFGRGCVKGLRTSYQITAVSPAAAARLAIHFYREDSSDDGKENK